MVKIAAKHRKTNGEILLCTQRILHRLALTYRSRQIGRASHNRAWRMRWGYRIRPWTRLLKELKLSNSFAGGIAAYLKGQMILKDTEEEISNMNNTKILQYFSILSLIFIICSGVYGILIGIHYTNEYLRLTEELRNQPGVTITAVSLLLQYFSGAFRGMITLASGIIGLANIRKQEVKTGYLVFLGILSLLYIFGWKRFPYTDEFLQMSAAVFCFVMLGIYKSVRLKNKELQTKPSRCQ